MFVIFVYATVFKACNNLKPLPLELNNKSRMIYTSFKINLWPLILKVVWSGPLLQFGDEDCSWLPMSVSLLSRAWGSPWGRKHTGIYSTCTWWLDIRQRLTDRNQLPLSEIFLKKEKAKVKVVTFSVLLTHSDELSVMLYFHGPVHACLVWWTH